MDAHKIPPEVHRFLTVKEAFCDPDAEQLWALCSPDERERLRKGATAWDAYMDAYAGFAPVFDLPDSVRLYHAYHVWGSPSDTEHERRQARARAIMRWRKLDHEQREKLQERADTWYINEFEKRGGARSYYRPRWMRIMLSLGFAE